MLLAARNQPHHAARTTSLLDADPDLAHAIPEGERAAAARALTVQVVALAGGPWVPGEWVGLGNRPWGVLVIDGMLIREVVVAGRANAELFASGDVLHPWERDSSALSCDVRWTSAGASIVVLDERFLTAARRWPGLFAALHERLVDQLARSARRAAIIALPRVEQRVLGLFWQLADRFGVVSSEGILIRKPLTHNLIGELVGAKRPTISLALNALATEGYLRRDPAGAWILSQDSIAEFAAEDAGAHPLPSKPAAVA